MGILYKTQATGLQPPSRFVSLAGFGLMALPSGLAEKMAIIMAIFIQRNPQGSLRIADPPANPQKKAAGKTRR